MFTNTLQYTHKSYLVNWIIDFTVAQGMPGLFKCMIVLLKYLRFKFVKMGFEHIMNYLSELTKKEVFINELYEKYLTERKHGSTDEQLRPKYMMHWEDFRFLNNFRERVNSLPLNTALIESLENKYELVTQKFNSKL
jgi:hypothetical protein